MLQSVASVAGPKFGGSGRFGKAFFPCSVADVDVAGGRGTQDVHLYPRCRRSGLMAALWRAGGGEGTVMVNDAECVAHPVARAVRNLGGGWRRLSVA